MSSSTPKPNAPPASPLRQSSAPTRTSSTASGARKSQRQPSSKEPRVESPEQLRLRLAAAEEVANQALARAGNAQGERDALREELAVEAAMREEVARRCEEIQSRMRELEANQGDSGPLLPASISIPVQSGSGKSSKRSQQKVAETPPAGPHVIHPGRGRQAASNGVGGSHSSAPPARSRSVSRDEERNAIIGMQAPPPALSRRAESAPNGVGPGREQSPSRASTHQGTATPQASLPAQRGVAPPPSPGSSSSVTNSSSGAGQPQQRRSQSRERSDSRPGVAQLSGSAARNQPNSSSSVLPSPKGGPRLAATQDRRTLVQTATVADRRAAAQVVSNSRGATTRKQSLDKQATTPTSAATQSTPRRISVDETPLPRRNLSEIDANSQFPGFSPAGDIGFGHEIRLPSREEETTQLQDRLAAEWAALRDEVISLKMPQGGAADCSLFGVSSAQLLAVEALRSSRDTLAALQRGDPAAAFSSATSANGAQAGLRDSLINDGRRKRGSVAPSAAPSKEACAATAALRERVATLEAQARKQDQTSAERLAALEKEHKLALHEKTAVDVLAVQLEQERASVEARLKSASAQVASLELRLRGADLAAQERLDRATQHAAFEEQRREQAEARASVLGRECDALRARLAVADTRAVVLQQSMDTYRVISGERDRPASRS